MIKWYLKTFIGKHMQSKIILLFFILLSTLLISVTLLFTAKPLYLAKVERERVANLQKVYHKSYFRKRNRHTPKRSIKFGQMEIDSILEETPIIFEKNADSLEHNQSRENFKTLTKVVNVLNNLKDKFVLQIETHTDKRGSKQGNLKISQKRADSIKGFINQRSNIVFISAIGYGEEIKGKKNRKKSHKKYLEIKIKRIKQ
jgi:outer membrane protein OmpA-like peptidoglycan-associated protein